MLATLPSRATWVWSDGSAEGGTTRGGGGARLTLASGEEREIRVPAGMLCSSTRAELWALRAALRCLADLLEHLGPDPVIACTDSRAALALLESGAGAQRSQVGTDIWELLTRITSTDREVRLQWVPAHCGLPGNERADALAKEAAALDQEDVPVCPRALTQAVSRAANRSLRRHWPDGLFRRIWRDRAPTPVATDDRRSAVDVHQLRAGHWGHSRQYVHRIGRLPTPACGGCNDASCPAALCDVCGEEADVPEHVLLRCPSLAGIRLRLFGTIYPDEEQLRDGDAVAALARSYLGHRELPGYGPR